MGCLNVAIHLVQQGAPADRATARGETPLHLAARAQQTDLIRVLLRNGAQVIIFVYNSSIELNLYYIYFDAGGR